ncbi:extracellular solute-binding protein [Saccharothrix coeruleofusca]|uniref:Sugar ABC transporter substrate-binding protein n=1 Tax=Saccharothrix coeruleofusca TaxID=33919 RepID=A0A918ANX0_9PSEU|nr:extracellular solute-binding protein [Saccharothrix coeruleofusca]MBP2337910.1 ABC-type glycerol-3-phosphate transport system substrate-binding protein [Saccharothrix coeruleofusca]GGP63070.1 sugar ABC transporter substrate-binding protein [Saccharothrix coeruleofusca]
MNSSSLRRAAGLLLAGSLGLTAVACSGSQPSGGGGKVVLSINGQPPQTQAFERKVFDEDVAEFEAANPDIDIQPHEGFMDPKTFSAKLAGGQLEDVFYAYFTDPAQLIARRQAADITAHVKDIPHYSEIRQELREVFSADGKVYGVPTANYAMGLLYNRELFTRAGLNPDQPPGTWAEVREAARKIAALGDGTVGFAEYSKNNQGGWHFTAWNYSLGNRIARRDGDKWVADFDNDKGEQVLQHLKDMRWTDNSMGDKQLLVLEDVQQMMGSGRLGMYLAAPDNVPTIVNQFKGDYKTYGLAGIPEGGGTLIGGEGYMVNPKATPEKVKAAMRWLGWKYLNPDRFEKNLQRYQEQGQPVGLPVPPVADIWTGEIRAQQAALKQKYATMPVSNFQSYVDSTAEGLIEPPNAQQVYAVLDNAMQAVLTNRDADPTALLAEAEAKVNQVLAQVK